MIHIRFDSQVRRLAGCSHTSIDVDADATLKRIVQRVAELGTSALQIALLDDAKQPRPSLLLFINDELVTLDQKVELQDGAELTITTLISGG